MPSETYFIFGYFGRRNTGDDSMLIAFIRESRKHRRDLRYLVLASKDFWIPKDLKDSVVPVPKHPRSIVRALMQAKQTAMVGGTSIQDFRANPRYIRVLASVMAIAVLCKATHKPFSLVAVGIGPLKTWWGRFLSGRIFRLASYISCRDSDSLTLVRDLVPSSNASLGFDLSVLLERSAKEPRAKRTLGVSILPYYEIYEGQPERDAALVKTLAGDIRSWLDSNPSSRVRVFVFKGHSGEDDVTISEHLAQLVGHQSEVVSYSENPEHTLRDVSECSVFVGMRLHSCLFSYISEVPIIMLDYHPKCESIAREVGLPAASRIRLDSVVSGRLYEALEGATAHPEAYSAARSVDLARLCAERDMGGFMSLQCRSDRSS